MDIPSEEEELTDENEEQQADVELFCKQEKVYCDLIQRQLARGIGTMRTPSGFHWLSKKYANPLIEELEASPHVSKKLELDRHSQVELFAAPYLDAELGRYIDLDWWPLTGATGSVLSHDDYERFSTRLYIVLFPPTQHVSTLRRRIQRDWKVDVALSAAAETTTRTMTKDAFRISMIDLASSGSVRERARPRTGAANASVLEWDAGGLYKLVEDRSWTFQNILTRGGASCRRTSRCRRTSQGPALFRASRASDGRARTGATERDEADRGGGQ